MKTTIKVIIQILIFDLSILPLLMIGFYLQPHDMCIIWWILTSILYGCVPATMLSWFNNWFDSKYNK